MIGGGIKLDFRMAFSDARLTDTSDMSGSSLRADSTCVTHAAQVIPDMGIVTVLTEVFEPDLISSDIRIAVSLGTYTLIIIETR